MAQKQTDVQALAELCKILKIADTRDVFKIRDGAKAFAAKYSTAVESAHAWKARADGLTSTSITNASAGNGGEGSMVLGAEEAQDIGVFGAADDLQQRKVKATEDRFGRSLADCLRDGLLK